MRERRNVSTMMHYPPWSCNGPLAAATPGGLFFVCRRYGQEWPLEMAVGRERGDEGAAALARLLEHETPGVCLTALSSRFRSIWRSSPSSPWNGVSAKGATVIETLLRDARTLAARATS